jgi:hypothetical protein
VSSKFRYNLKNIFELMVRELSKTKIGNRIYFVDYKLRELRNVNNPHDRKCISIIFFSKSKKENYFFN